MRRVLGPVNLTAIGIGGIIGAGIFVLTGHAAAAYAGPGIGVALILPIVMRVISMIADVLLGVVGLVFLRNLMKDSAA